MVNRPNLVKNIRRKAQSLVEYAMLLVFVGVFLIVALETLGVSTIELFSYVVCEINFDDDCRNGKALTFVNEFDVLGLDWVFGAWRKSNRVWSIEDGKLVSERSASVLFPEFFSGNYAITLNDVEFNNFGSRWQGLSLHFNSSNEDGNFTGYALRIQSRGDGDFAYFQEYNNGLPVMPTISNLTLLPPSFNWSNTSDIRVVVQGNTFTGYIDGVQVAQGQDDTYSGGTIGLASHNNSIVTIESIEVEPMND